MDKLFAKVAVGAFWAVFTKLCVKSLGFVSTIILARILFPEDFGLIAIALMIVSFLEIFTSFGFDINIIRKKEVKESTLNSAWTFKLASGVIIFALIYLSSDYLALYFNNESLAALLVAISFLPIIKGAENIGFVLYRKELDLKKEFHLEVISKVISFVVTVSSALILKSYWALVIGLYANYLARVFISYYMHSYRPKIDLSEINELFHFSKWLLLNNVLIFLNRKITSLVVAKFAGTASLGYYSIGKEIANLPTTELVFPMSRAMYPGYAKMSGDKKAMKQLFLKISRLVIYATAPICFGIAITAGEVVPVLLGDKWLPIVDVIYFLSFFAFLRCSIQSAGSVFIALGKPKIPVMLSVIQLVALSPLLYFFVLENEAIGAAQAVLLASFFMTPLAFYFLHRLIRFSLQDMYQLFFNPLCSAIVMFFGVMHLAIYLTSYSLISILIIKVLAGLVLFSVTSGLITVLSPQSNIAWQLYREKKSMNK